MKVIEVEGNEILVDDEDHLFLTSFYNLRMNGVYVQCNIKNKYRGMALYSGLQLQKLLMNPDKTGRSINVDHRDGNENNYQKENLRVCTHAENMRNRKVSVGGKSEYKGVQWHKANGVWQAYIKLDSKMHHLGYFKDEVSAANCYNYHAMIMHKDFANLNDCNYMPKEVWLANKIEKDKLSKYRGVSKADGKWIAQIYHRDKNIRIGTFENELDAAIAYNEKALELKGSKAKLNIIELVE